MNTHILIPIKEWEAQRELYRSKLKEIDKAQIDPSHEYYRLQGICANMDSILAHEKQISLDEKDTIDVLKISLDAVAEAMVTMDKMNNSMDKTEKLFWTAGHTVGYEQALKDLL